MADPGGAVGERVKQKQTCVNRKGVVFRPACCWGDWPLVPHELPQAPVTASASKGSYFFQFIYYHTHLQAKVHLMRE